MEEGRHEFFNFHFNIKTYCIACYYLICSLEEKSEMQKCFLPVFLVVQYFWDLKREFLRIKIIKNVECSKQNFYDKKIRTVMVVIW